MSNKIHSFPRAVAREHGTTAAIILPFLAYKTSMSKINREGKPRWYGTLDDFKAHYEYLSRTAINDGVSTLVENQLIEIANFNRRKADKTRWYHVSPEVQHLAFEDKIRFDADVAKQAGVTAAVLYHNLRYHLAKKVSKGDAQVTHKMRPKELEELLPFSKSAIKDALKKLVKLRLIEKTSKTKPEYRLFPAEMQALREKAVLGRRKTGGKG